jgi:hypothetical protein
VKLKDTDFDIFKSECLKWIEFFGLKGWDVYFDEDAKCEDGNMAETCIGPLSARNVTFHFKGSDNPAFNNPGRSAFHEVCEILLYRLHCLAESRFISVSEVDEAVHDIIRILENTVYEKLKGGSC